MYNIKSFLFISFFLTLPAFASAETEVGAAKSGFYNYRYFTGFKYGLITGSEERNAPSDHIKSVHLDGYELFLNRQVQTSGVWSYQNALESIQHNHFSGRFYATSDPYRNIVRYIGFSSADVLKAVLYQKIRDSEGPKITFLFDDMDETLRATVAFDISKNGKVIVGRLMRHSGKQELAIWREGEKGFSSTPETFFPDYNYGEARAVSEDGGIIVGRLWGNIKNPGPKAFVKQDAQSMLLPNLEGMTGSGAYDVSDDGSVIVGWSAKEGQVRAVKWTRNLKTKNFEASSLGYFSHIFGREADSPIITKAWFVTPDGEYIGGSSQGHAFIWHKKTGIQNVQDKLSRSGIKTFKDQHFLQTRGARKTEEGLIVVGNGISLFKEQPDLSKRALRGTPFGFVVFFEDPVPQPKPVPESVVPQPEPDVRPISISEVDVCVPGRGLCEGESLPELVPQPKPVPESVVPQPEPDVRPISISEVDVCVPGRGLCEGESLPELVPQPEQAPVLQPEQAPVLQPEQAPVLQPGRAGFINVESYTRSVNTLTQLSFNALRAGQNSLENTQEVSRHYDCESRQGKFKNTYPLVCPFITGSFSKGFNGPKTEVFEGFLGLTVKLSPGLRVGFGGIATSSEGKTGQNIDTSFYKTTSKSKGFGAGLFMAYEHSSGFELTTSLIGQTLEGDMVRGYYNGASLEKTFGKPKGSFYGAALRLAFALPLPKSFDIKPFIAYHTGRVRYKAYREYGPALFTGDVSKQSLQFNEGRLGVESVYDLSKAFRIFGEFSLAHSRTKGKTPFVTIPLLDNMVFGKGQKIKRTTNYAILSIGGRYQLAQNIQLHGRFSVSQGKKKDNISGFKTQLGLSIAF